MTVAPVLQLQASAPGAIALSGDLVFANAAAALQQVRAAVAGAGSVLLDLRGVARADSAGLAVLLALAAEARAAGRELRLREVPASLRALAHLGEVERLLGLDPA